MLPGITESQHALIQEVVSRIVETAHPEKIICYGVRAKSHNFWSSFISTDKTNAVTTMDLLIILHYKDKSKRESISDAVEKLSNESLSLIPIVHSIDAVNSNLESGNPFFVTLYKKGVLLYDNNAVPLIAPPTEVNPEVQTSFDTGTRRKFDLGQALYESAVECSRAGRYEVAVFMLHQAVELTSISLLRNCLGYKPTTHSIRRLFLLLENITLDIHEIFPRSTESDLEIFNILQRAYSDVRYKELYSVSSESVSSLLSRVAQFQKLASNICQAKWEEIQSVQLVEVKQSRFINTYNLPPFESIGLDTFSDIIFQKGDAEAIQIESDADMAHIIGTNIEDNRLWITTKNESFEVIPHSIIRLTYSTLSSVVVNHSGEVTCKEPIEANFFGIIQNGKGQVNLKVDVSILDATVTKTGTLRISGSALKANIMNTGPGSFEGLDLEASEAKVTIKDSGGISIQVEDELNAFLEGDGNLQLKGKPRLRRFTMD
ncbi:MAG: HEPN domain-containing protein [Cyclobacteriaceae bacterium]|nr:HEPN domain-containing protein [Cyclobacteriaceae bacterium]